MKYLCLIYHEEAALDALPEPEYNAITAELRRRSEDLPRVGQVVMANVLQPVQTATTLRVRNGKTTIIDGPFAETREQLGGFLLIEATDLNDAIRLAAKLPPARLGCIEIRAIDEHHWQRADPIEAHP